MRGTRRKRRTKLPAHGRPDTAAAEGAIIVELDLGQVVLSTPSIAHGALYVRSDGTLWKLKKS
jgi:hypothetical protein